MMAAPINLDAVQLDSHDLTAGKIYAADWNYGHVLGPPASIV
jgi:hypothetical protein